MAPVIALSRRVSMDRSVDILNPAIEGLEALAFAPGDWQGWSAETWNQQLLLFCFVRDHTRQPADPLRATLSDLPLLVRDARADPTVIAQSLVQKLKWQATQHNGTPLSLLAAGCRAQQRKPSREPSFFVFLWTTCLIAHGYPDAAASGRFWERYSRVFPRCKPADRCWIDQGWELLSEWLELGHQFHGFPWQQLELPPVDTWQVHITHSWNLAFPSLRDRQLMQRALEPLQRQLTPGQATNPAVVQALLQQPGFSAPLRHQLEQLQRSLAAGRSPSARVVELLERELQRARHAGSGRRSATHPHPLAAPEPQRGYGPLLLIWLDDTYGLLLLHSPSRPIPAGLRVDRANPFLPAVPLLIPTEPEDPDFAALDAGSLAIDPQAELLPALQPLLRQGVLPFAMDPQLQQLRLAFDSSCGVVQHALIRNDLVPLFLQHHSAEPLEATEEHWQAFRAVEPEGFDLWRFPHQQPRTSQETVQLSPCAGLRLAAGQGFLATGLGLPAVQVHGPHAPLKVALLSAGGDLIEYQPHSIDADAADTGDAADASAATDARLWQPARSERRRLDITPGTGRLVAFFNGAPTVERSLTLSALPPRVLFRRQAPLALREDWGRQLGPLILPDSHRPAEPPGAADLAWARHRLNHGDPSVNQLFEEQMLDSLTALFQRRDAITRADFHQLHHTLLGQQDHWPGFAAAVLRGWCEGGWIEEGVEQRRGHWRIQPVDPRLVRLPGGRAQLVGLLPSRGLAAMLAHAHSLGMDVQAVLPSCAHLPRGWRFTGRCDELAVRSGLPLVELHHWVEHPLTSAWLLDAGLACDGPPWPTGLDCRHSTDRICGRRGKAYHATPQLQQGLRAPISLSLDHQCSRYGRRRWLSHDPNGGASFISCHRNRAALHALLCATNGLWPFWIADAAAARLERLYDAEAYLPLPIGRYAALTGQQMPGPTRQRPSDHTYRYSVDAAFLECQRDTLNLPLTSL